MQLNQQEYVDINEKGTKSTVFWGCHDTPLGPVILGVGPEGHLVHMDFASGYGLTYDISEWKRGAPDTEFVPASARTAALASRFSQMEGGGLNIASFALYGRAFALKVWRATLQAQEGQEALHMEAKAA